MSETIKLDINAVRGVLKERTADAHKGDFGRLVCVAGSDRYRGAAGLCAEGALMCGAGLVYVASGEKALAAVAARLPEAILVDTESDGEFFAETLGRATACAVGCGLARGDGARRALEAVIENAGCPLVIDADGINLMSSDIELKRKLQTRSRVLTPHIGEFARLTGLSVCEINAGRERLAREYAASEGCLLVLKSERTIIALPDSTVYVNTLGNSGLAKGGSGDLLSGMIGSFAAMGYALADAAALGVYLHSRAADILAETVPKHCMTASAVAKAIPTAMAELLTTE